MDNLLSRIRACRHCEPHLPLGPRPVVQLGPNARILIVGQAPGTKVHASGIPWDDPSGRLLHQWMGIDESIFYDPEKIAIVPMGFCYPGKGKSGDLPPRPECAPTWHQELRDEFSKLELTLLIGTYAQTYYLGKRRRKNLTETVRNYSEYLPEFFPLPHPSPRNRYWLAKNVWFGEHVLPEFAKQIKHLLS